VFSSLQSLYQNTLTILRKSEFTKRLNNNQLRINNIFSKLILQPSMQAAHHVAKKIPNYPMSITVLYRFIQLGSIPPTRFGSV
jgi:hypothetical protein